MPDVRDARSGDLEAIAAVYAEAAETPATFDLEGKPVDWWRAVLDALDAASGRLLLVAVDGGGTVLGYAKSGEHRDKPAYATTVETSVYVGSRHQGQRAGDALYRELLARLDRTQLRLAVAGVTQPNDASNRLHRAHGFSEIGTFRGVGVKHGRAWDVLWYQRPLAGAPAL